jgi:hypothetical protein
MNRKELKKQLKKLGVNRGYYSLDGYELPDRIVLSKSSNGWSVFYIDDRGNRCNNKHFTNEDEACEYLLDELLKEKSLQDKINSQSDSNCNINRDH